MVIIFFCWSGRWNFWLGMFFGIWFLFLYLVRRIFRWFYIVFKFFNDVFWRFILCYDILSFIISYRFFYVEFRGWSLNNLCKIIIFGVKGRIIKIVFWWFFILSVDNFGVIKFFFLWNCEILIKFFFVVVFEGVYWC